MLLSRRGIIGGLIGGLVAAPTIVKFDSLMPVSSVPLIMPNATYIALHGSDGEELSFFGRTRFVQGEYLSFPPAAAPCEVTGVRIYRGDKYLKSIPFDYHGNMRMMATDHIKVKANLAESLA